ncbi:hypothetical protein OA509_02520 [Prochlorococcus sp. AH-716-I19]|nr:hypothetical protein [Prochlorococcus sp. AH-716-I19]
MALNDKFTIQEINMETKEFSYDINAKELKDYWSNVCEKHPTNNHCKVYCD